VTSCGERSIEVKGIVYVRSSENSAKGGAQIGIESIVCRRLRNGDQQPRGTELHDGAQCRSAPKQGEKDEARMMIAQKPALASGQCGRILWENHGILSARGHGGGEVNEVKEELNRMEKLWCARGSQT
jgi:hypothetical protein